MLTFYGTKEIKAQPMTRGDYNVYRGWQTPANENPSDEGYLVEYVDSPNSNHPDHDGYISWSPKAVFENAYQQSGGLSFGHALFAYQQGRRIAREGWNGKGQFVYMVPAKNYPAQTAAAYHYFGDMVPYGSYAALKNAQDEVVPWTPSQGDLSAHDWIVLD